MVRVNSESRRRTWGSRTVATIKQELRKHNLSTTGRKEILVQRLSELRPDSPDVNDCLTVGDSVEVKHGNLWYLGKIGGYSSDDKYSINYAENVKQIIGV